MKELFEVEVDPVDGSVTLHLNATPGKSFAGAVARKLLNTIGFPNKAVEAMAHQLGQGSRVCSGTNANGCQVGPERAAETYPALEGKVFFDSETEALPQESVETYEIKETQNDC